MGSAETKIAIIRILRMANNYSVKDVASLTGYSTSHVYQMECGSVKIGHKALENIANIYKLDMFQIMELIRYYESLNVDDRRKHQFTLLKVLNMMLKISR